MTDGVVERSRPRDRILETARDMFHKHGIKGVGVDAITEAAGTNKMTLYRHFESKDELIVECLRANGGQGRRDVGQRSRPSFPATSSRSCMPGFARRPTCSTPTAAAATWPMPPPS